MGFIYSKFMGLSGVFSRVGEMELEGMGSRLEELKGFCLEIG